MSGSDFTMFSRSSVKRLSTSNCLTKTTDAMNATVEHTEWFNRIHIPGALVAARENRRPTERLLVSNGIITNDRSACVRPRWESPEVFLGLQRERPNRWPKALQRSW